MWAPGFELTVREGVREFSTQGLRKSWATVLGAYDVLGVLRTRLIIGITDESLTGISATGDPFPRPRGSIQKMNPLRSLGLRIRVKVLALSPEAANRGVTNGGVRPPWPKQAQMGPIGPKRAHFEFSHFWAFFSQVLKEK